MCCNPPLACALVLYILANTVDAKGPLITGVRDPCTRDAIVANRLLVHGVNPRRNEQVAATDPRFRFADFDARVAVQRAVHGAARRLADGRCQWLMAEFADRQGVSLVAKLNALGMTPTEYLDTLRFVDAPESLPCRSSSATLPFTTPGQRTVYVCPLPFKQLYRVDSRAVEFTVIHEVLHTLGLDARFRRRFPASRCEEEKAMANGTRNLAMATTMVTGVVAAPRMTAADRPTKAVASSATAPLTTRVRSDNPAIASLIRDATQRSATFRDLVETIDASDGIVYVQGGKCAHRGHACLVHSVTVAGPSRLLRVLVDTKRTDWELMASIAHELRHAVEVLGDPTIRSDGAVYFFYRREGVISGESLLEGFETEAAIRAGNMVQKELRRSNR